MEELIVEVHPLANTIAIAVLALFVIASTFVSPLILARMQDRKHDKDKEVDYKRQDAVAKQAMEAAALLLAEQQKTALLLLDNNRVVAETAAGVKSDLQAIHTFVNSDKTDSMVRELALLREIVELRKQGGAGPGSDILAEIEKLCATIETRTAATRAVENREERDHLARIEKIGKEIGPTPLEES